MFWGIYLILEKYYMIAKHRYLFGMKLIAEDHEMEANESTMRKMQSALREFEKI